MKIERISQSTSLVRTISTALVGLLVVVSSVFLIIDVKQPAHAATNTSFSFTSVGDYGESSYTTANLNYIGKSGAKFNLALGDLNYDSAHVSAAQWSSYVQSHLPAGFAFEILAGNEDPQISALATDLPDHIGNISGTYAQEYSFDYPSNAPLARFIFASPGGILPGYDYSQGSTHYNWVAKQIDDARSAGIPWVIVGMHEYCLAINQGTPGTCSSLDLMNLLVSKKVDLILYGHQHNYQVSKQLALNSATCRSLTIGTYNANCVVNSSTSLTKGAGSVMVINGTGGKSIVKINANDPDRNYFRTWEGSNIHGTMGVNFVTVSQSTLTVKFVAVSKGNFTDSFTITSNSSPVPPTTTP
jgi:Calcineurin-like phosphoesterase